MKYNKKHLKKYLPAAVVVVIAAGGVYSGNKPESITDNVIQRPEYNEESQTLAVNVYAEGEDKPFYVELEIQPKKYTDTQIQDIFDTVYEQLKELIKGENTELSEVTEDLNLVTVVEGYPVTIEWYSQDYTLIDYDGTVYNSDFLSQEQKDVELLLILSYENYSRQYSVMVTVKQPQLTSHREKEQGIQSELNRMITEDNSDTLKLPKQINGVNVSYEYAKENESILLIILPIIALILLPLKKYQDRIKRQQLRKEQLKYDYAEVIAKLTLLAGAGMSMQRAWEKVAYDYEQNRKRSGKRYVYEEMLRTCMEFKSGVSQKCAYEHFGNRCDTKEYRKLSSLLAQNVKKGTNDILKLLEEESKAAFEEHKNLAVKKGEEAGTKLLLPMIMLLVIVMIIMMFPAMTSFGI